MAMNVAVQRVLDKLPLATRLTLPNGTQIGSDAPQLEVHAKTSKVLANLATGQVGLLGDDYVNGQFEFSGSMRDLMDAAAAILPDTPMNEARAGMFTQLILRLSSIWRHSMERDAKQIEFHYDLSDAFFALWLDPRRVYSCAYYKEPTMNLAQAQEQKLDLICRKLDLQATDRFLDMGAGWGGLLLWAAENYGVNATGITLSHNQHRYVNQLIKERGLEGRVQMLLLDYRKLPTNEPFDKIASVGMFEHVGRAQLTQYFMRLYELLTPEGMVLNHGITAGGVGHTQLGAGMGDFIEKYIFPGGELTHVSHVLLHLAEGGLESLDVENLRPHYARTLWAWSDALEENLTEAKQVLEGEQGQRALRAYRMYLAGCAMSFEHGWISLHQILAQRNDIARAAALAQPTESGKYPWRRDYIYNVKR